MISLFPTLVFLFVVALFAGGTVLLGVSITGMAKILWDVRGGERGEQERALQVLARRLSLRLEQDRLTGRVAGRRVMIEARLASPLQRAAVILQVGGAPKGLLVVPRPPQRLFNEPRLGDPSFERRLVVRGASHHLAWLMFGMRRTLVALRRLGPVRIQKGTVRLCVPGHLHDADCLEAQLHQLLRAVALFDEGPQEPQARLRAAYQLEPLVAVRLRMLEALLAHYPVAGEEVAREVMVEGSPEAQALARSFLDWAAVEE